jgi:hypothetical protein
LSEDSPGYVPADQQKTTIEESFNCAALSDCHSRKWPPRWIAATTR